MLISKSADANVAVERFTSILQHAERLEVAGRRLYEAGCNLTRRMMISIFCDPAKKVKVKFDSNSKTNTFLCGTQI